MPDPKAMLLQAHEMDPAVHAAVVVYLDARDAVLWFESASLFDDDRVLTGRGVGVPAFLERAVLALKEARKGEG